MAAWQIATGLSIATLVPLGFLLIEELEYVSGYWGWLWRRYWYPLSLFGSTLVLSVFFVFYQVSRLASLGDVGQRIGVMDRSVREGRAGDPDLVRGLQRESGQGS